MEHGELVQEALCCPQMPLAGEGVGAAAWDFVLPVVIRRDASVSGGALQLSGDPLVPLRNRLECVLRQKATLP